MSFQTLPDEVLEKIVSHIPISRMVPMQNQPPPEPKNTLSSLCLVSRRYYHLFRRRLHRAGYFISTTFGAFFLRTLISHRGLESNLGASVRALRLRDHWRQMPLMLLRGLLAATKDGLEELALEFLPVEDWMPLIRSCKKLHLLHLAYMQLVTKGSKAQKFASSLSSTSVKYLSIDSCVFDAYSLSSGAFPSLETFSLCNAEDNLMVRITNSAHLRKFLLSLPTSLKALRLRLNWLWDSWDTEPFPCDMTHCEWKQVLRRLDNLKIFEIDWLNIDAKQDLTFALSTSGNLKENTLFVPFTGQYWVKQFTAWLKDPSSAPSYLATLKKLTIILVHQKILASPPADHTELERIIEVQQVGLDFKVKVKDYQEVLHECVFWDEFLPMKLWPDL